MRGSIEVKLPQHNRYDYVPLPEEVLRLGQLALAPDQRRSGLRQVARDGLEGCERRDLTAGPLHALRVAAETAHSPFQQRSIL